MTDVLGWRRQIRRDRTVDQHVVQPDFDDMRSPGVTNHYSRIFTPNADAVSNDSFRAATDVIAGNVLDAVRTARCCAAFFTYSSPTGRLFFTPFGLPVEDLTNFKSDIFIGMDFSRFRKGNLL